MKIGIVTAVVVVAVLVIVTVRKTQLIRGEGFRKLLHFVCLILLGTWHFHCRRQHGEGEFG